MADSARPHDYRKYTEDRYFRQELRHIQNFLGHAVALTTEIRIHSSRGELDPADNPLD